MSHTRGKAHEHDQAHPGREPFRRLEDGYLPPLLADGTEQTAQALWDEAARQTRAEEEPAPQCPVCYPPTFNYNPPEEGLEPEACPARGDHEIITRAFAYLGKVEAGLHGFSRDQHIAKVRADIDRFRTAHQAVAQSGTDDLR